MIGTIKPVSRPDPKLSDAQGEELKKSAKDKTDA